MMRLDREILHKRRGGEGEELYSLTCARIVFLVFFFGLARWMEIPSIVKEAYLVKVVVVAVVVVIVIVEEVRC